MTKITCKWAKEEKYLINPDGQVWPCCYLCNNVFKHGRDLTHQPIYEEYFKVKDELNIFKNDINSILRHEWYTKTLPNSWKDEKITLRQCKNHCSEE